MRGGRAGYAVPRAHARCPALAGSPEDPPPGVDEQHEIRRDHRFGDRGRRAGQHPRRPDPGRRPGRDRREDGRRLLHPGPGARHRRTQDRQGPRAHPMTTTLDGSAAVAALRTTSAIRERARHLLQRARTGDSPWFLVDDDALTHAAVEVAEVTRTRYPTLAIPYHSRW